MASEPLEGPQPPPPSPRRRVRFGTFLLVVVLAVVLAAAHGARHTITLARAPTIAAKINLPQSNVAGMRPAPAATTARDHQLEKAQARCVGGAGGYAVERSPVFTTSTGARLAIDSTTTILSTAGLVSSGLARIASPHGIACLEAQLRAAAAAGGERVHIAATRLNAGIKGSDGTRLLRITATVTARRPSHPPATIYEDLFAIGYAQALIELQVRSSGVRPSLVLERRLAVFLLDRAKTQIG